jgi:DNA gyrase subunit A
MLITTGGVLIRTRVKEIREMGRATQGVILINLGQDEKLAGLEKVVDRDDAELPNGEEVHESTDAGLGEEQTPTDDGSPDEPESGAGDDRSTEQ